MPCLPSFPRLARRGAAPIPRVARPLGSAARRGARSWLGGLNVALSSLGEPQQKRESEEPGGDPHEPAPLRRDPEQADGHARAAEPGLDREEALHFLRNA